MGLPPFIAGALGDAVDASLNSLLDSYLNWDSTKCGEFDIEKALGDAITAGIQEAILGIGVGKLSGALMGKLKSSFGISGKPKKPSKPKKADSGHGSKSSSDGGACNIQLSRANCFAEGTLVDTEHGLLPIEQIEPGMRVWSYDTATEEWQLSEVTVAWRSWHDGEMVELEFAGESVLATAAHPIWLTSGERLDTRPKVTELPASESRLHRAGSRWVEAAHIRAGDAGLSRTAGTQPVHGRPIGTQARWVYNFEVAGTHTYTVGSTGLLVHNTCGDAAPPKKTPNPHGKLGGPEHRAKVDEVAEEMRKRGLDVRTEVNIKTPGGGKKSRFADVGGFDREGNLVEIAQIGRQTKAGIPVARERRAMHDIGQAEPTVSMTFHAYN